MMDRKQKKFVRFLFITFLAIILTFILTACKTSSEKEQKVANFNYQVTDVQGTVVKFEKKPERILTLAMGTDGIVLGLVPPTRLVGVNHLLDDPNSSNIVAKAKQIPTKIKNPTAEQIYALKPDVVIVPNWGKAEIVDNLRDLGLKVVVCKGASTIEEVQENVLLIARTLGEEAKGLKLVEKMKAKLQEIDAKVIKIAPAQRKKVVLISLMASYGGIGSSFDAICTRAGVINGVAEAGIKNGQILGKERLVEVNPDFLILPVYNDHGNFDINKHNNEFLLDPSLQTLTAVKERKLYYPREGYIYNVSQDIVFGVQELAYAAYGESFTQPADCHLSVVEE